MSARATTSNRPVLPATLRLGSVHLTVTDLDRSIQFYENVIGLSVIDRTGDHARLGAGGAESVVLVADPEAETPGRESGLYHYALLFPDRAELARAAARIARTHTPIQGASDHHTHEAIYLPDPDGIGIELAADRPRAEWPDMTDGRWLSNGPDPLDIEGLLAQIEGEEPRDRAEAGLRIGHVHLHVADVERAMAYYTEVIGFETQADLGVAGFVSAGGYHHHLAFNVWRGRDVAPASPGRVGLRHWTIEIDRASLEHLRARLDAAGVPHEPHGDGIIARDPFGIAAAIMPSSSS